MVALVMGCMVFALSGHCVDASLARPLKMPKAPSISLLCSPCRSDDVGCWHWSLAYKPYLHATYTEGVSP